MKLTDTQTIILSAAAGRDDGSIHPLPKTLKGGAVTKVTGALLRKGLIAEAPRRNGAAIGETNFAITAEGALAINVEPAECPHLADTGAQAVRRRPGDRTGGGHAPAKAKKAATGRDTARTRRASNAPVPSRLA